MIKGDSYARNKALEHIYSSNRERVCLYISSNKGTREEAVDIFQESMIAFYENVRDLKFRGESKISTYLYSIAKFKWLNQIKKNDVRTFHHENLEIETSSISPLTVLIDDEKREGVLEVLSLLGEVCKNILVAHLYYNASMKEIAVQGNFSSEQVVRNKKYKCLKNLKELIKLRPSIIFKLQGNE